MVDNHTHTYDMVMGFFPKKEVLNNTPWVECCWLMDKDIHYVSNYIDPGFPKWYPEVWQDWELKPLPQRFSLDTREEIISKLPNTFKKLRHEMEYDDRRT